MDFLCLFWLSGRGGIRRAKFSAGGRLYSAVMVRVSVLLVVTGIGEP